MAKDFHGGMTPMGVPNATEEVKKNVATFWETIEKEKKQNICEDNGMKLQTK